MKLLMISNIKKETTITFVVSGYKFYIVLYCISAVYLRYRHIHSKVKQWNLIASNGVIHVLMQFLYDVKRPEITTSMLAHPADPSTLDGSIQAAVTTKCSLAVVLGMQLLLFVIAVHR